MFSTYFFAFSFGFSSMLLLGTSLSVDLSLESSPYSSRVVFFWGSNDTLTRLIPRNGDAEPGFIGSLGSLESIVGKAKYLKGRNLLMRRQTAVVVFWGRPFLYRLASQVNSCSAFLLVVL
ncbi:hypothetical protein GGS20DRAFT_558042, partial [Poronia punctata]